MELRPQREVILRCLYGYVYAHQNTVHLDNMYLTAQAKCRLSLWNCRKDKRETNVDFGE
jgi:hypothetical protein